jgi:bleomycin hydrolase
MKLEKLFFIVSVLFFYNLSLLAQVTENEDYKFTIIQELGHTPVKNQYHTSTCWSFSGLSFFESEMLRLGKPEISLSEMYVVNYCYRNKAQKFIRMKGNTNFGPGGIFYDIIDVINRYGIVPEQVYPGIKYNEDKHDHAEMDEVLRKMVEAVNENKSRKLTPIWMDAVKKTVDTYLGEIPEKFDYNGQTYTPKSFVSDYCGIKPDNYIQITSFTHHPFYEPFILEVPDNWIWSNFYNVPLDVMQQIIDNSLENGYTVAWAADVTEKGFATTKKGIAVVPDMSTSADSIALCLKKDSVTDTKKGTLTFSPNKPFKEKVITQELRQVAFDNQETTDDHGMHIIGLAKDQNGKVYYKVKNSWGNYNSYDGYFYASKPYVRYKTTSIMVNKNAIPDDIRKKLGIL